MLEAKSLRKALIPSTLIENPSPGNIQSTRIAIHVNEDNDSYVLYIASGRQIYKLKIPREDSEIGEGKEGLLIPESTQVSYCSLMNRCPHRSEIQSVVLAEDKGTGYLMLGSVDSYGYLLVSKLNTSGEDVNGLTYSVLPHDYGVGEGSWSGLCFSPNQCCLTAVTRSFCRTVDLYDQDIYVRTLRTLWYPTSSSFVQNLGNGNGNSVLAITEGSQLSFWDLRMNENGGCIHRICGSIGDALYAVCSSSTNNVAVGGADRTVTIYDPRRWSALSRWVHCSKYEITGLFFSSIDPSYIYIQGLDYEVICGQWRKSEKLFSFRGDSNWLGFNKCFERDVLGGWCDTGSVFVADVADANDVNVVVGI